MSEKSKIIITEEELSALEGIHEKKETLEAQVRALIKQAMKVQAEGMDELHKEQSELWSAIYTKYGVEDNEETSYSIHRETRELVKADSHEGCGNPDCPVCSDKSPIGGLLKSLLGRIASAREERSTDDEPSVAGAAPGFKVMMSGKSGANH